MGYLLSANPANRTNRNRTSYGKNNNIGNVPPPFGYVVSDAQTQFASNTIMLLEWAPNQGGGANGLEQVGATWNIFRNEFVQPRDPCTGNWGARGAFPMANVNANANPLIVDRNDPDQLASVANPTRVPSWRHNEGSNYVLCDGHAKWYRQQAVVGQCGFSPTPEMGNDGQRPYFQL
jgi:prepilin-type processing-associated H-X9-DG protein